MDINKHPGHVGHLIIRKVRRLPMSKKLIEFLVHFSNFSYNIIAYFYVEICVIYQIYILQKFKA